MLDLANSFMTEVPIIKKPVHLFFLRINDWFLFGKDSVMKGLMYFMEMVINFMWFSLQQEYETRYISSYIPGYCKLNIINKEGHFQKFQVEQGEYLPSRHLLVHNQQWKHPNDVQNLFKVNTDAKMT